MITPRLTRLVRVPDLPSLQATTADLVSGGDPFEARSRVVLLPTRGAAESFRRTLESRLLERGGRSVCVLPELLTRTEFYSRLHADLPDAPALLTDFDREVLFRRAARLIARTVEAPFRLRPGLIVAMLAFYDELRRRDRTIGDFERLMTDSLEPSVEIDRGAERMMRQTRFLSGAFAEFERSVAATGLLDEHGLRRRIIESDVPVTIRHVIVTVADQTTDAMGLWTADYDLLARMPGVERIDVLGTENLLASGFHQRIHDLFPGLEEERCGGAGGLPVLVAPEVDREGPPTGWFTCRDREEELAEAAARVKIGDAGGSVALVFQRPLPYLYLAKHVFADAGVPYQALDALPLASEPFAAALDLVFAAALSECNRASLIELLGSPHWRFRTDQEEPLSRPDVRALNAFLLDVRYLGGWQQLAGLSIDSSGTAASRRRGRRQERLGAALQIAAEVGARLQGVCEAPTASRQIQALLRFVREYERLPSPADLPYHRHARARAAVLDALESFAAAYRAHDDERLGPGELAGTVRRWIEGQTFSPRTGAGGVALLDAPAAVYADADEVWLLGLVENDWPDRAGRNIFYPASLLAHLGWPLDRERLAAARSRFRDLLRLARRRVGVSTFTLEGDAIVPPSPFLDEIDAAGLPVERRKPVPRPRVFVHEALAESPVIPDAVDGAAAEWLAVRMSRTASAPERFRGAAGARTVAAHAVSHVERYLECPFKYFAMYVLRLDEEPRDQSGLTPQERGQLLHGVFEHFFQAWHDAGHRAITGANLPDALAVFERIAEARLATLSETDRALERTYLLGSAVAPGLAERAFAFEIEHGVGVIERLLEHPLEGAFLFEARGLSRRVNIRAKADRIDLLEDGTLRVVDYKLGRAPKPARALQLPIYGICAAQHLDGRHGRRWTLSRAGYVAFRERNAFVPLGAGQSGALDAALEDGQHRFLTAVAAIEAGRYPVDPDEPFLCTRCGYAGVCRKDYVGDE